jgi:hypothetical protein
MTRRRPTEVQVQRAVIKLLAWCARPGVFAFHVPLGGYRTPTEAAIFKGIGTVAGIPDVVCIFEGRVFALELKTERGRITEVQQVTHDRMRAAGAIVAAAHGVDEAIAQLSAWGLLRRSSLAREKPHDSDARHLGAHTAPSQTSGGTQGA